MSMLEGPLEQITNQLQEFQRAAAGLRRVRELMDVERSVREGSLALPAAKAYRIEFDNVRFSYSGSAEKEVLKGLSFHLEPGEKLGLIGRTGSGKTTLVRLLFRLYDATHGRILVDGLDLRETRIDALRHRIGLVTQDVQLFHGTVRDNLTFFNRQVPDERIQGVIDQLGIHTWVKGLRQGLETPLEASGSGLSAGESQLLAFVRVFLKDPGLVILDEPSSRLDPATERMLSRAVDRLLDGRTGIIIAHRLETVERVDKIMVLADGRILEYGPRAALAVDPKSCYYGLKQVAAEHGTDGSLDEQMERLGG
jgi:ATP-binding cassette, subfamily B, bacterial